jgi:hypothetical protein
MEAAMTKPLDETIRQILSAADDIRSALRATPEPPPADREPFLCTVDAFKLVEVIRAADQYLDLGGPMARRELIKALDALMPDPPWPRVQE